MRRRHYYETMPPRRHNTKMRILVLLLLISYGIYVISADKSLQTISFNLCNEKATNSPFQITDCAYYTRYTATVDVAGGGSFSQKLSIVGNPGDTTLTIDSAGVVGATECPPQTSCSTLLPSVDISFIRSPLPGGMQTILPGSNINFGLAFPLNLLVEESGTGLPYAYEITQVIGPMSSSGCSKTDGSGCSTPFPQLVQQEIVTQPSCGVGPVPPATGLRGTCGALAPNPTGYIADGQGPTCYEVCCCDSSSYAANNISAIQVRQLSPKCWMFQAGPPTVVTDIGIEISSAQIPPGLNPLLLPLYAQVSSNSAPIVNSSYPYARATIQGIKDTTKYVSTFANKVANGRFVFCGDAAVSYDVIPDDTTPVSNVADLTWMYLPLPYQSFYYQGQQGGTSADQQLSKGIDQHVSSYGPSGQQIEQNIISYLIKTYGATAVQQCYNLANSIPVVPGYDTDNLIESNVPFNLPSFCYMLNLIRSGDTTFMAPGAILPSQTGYGKFNWMIKKINGLFYAIYFPPPSQYPSALPQDFLTIAVDFATPGITNYSAVSLPVTVVPNPGPTCVFQNPKVSNKTSTLGNGWFQFQMEGTGYIGSQDVGYQTDPIYVNISCIGTKGRKNSYGTLSFYNTTFPIVMPSLGAGEKSASYTLFIDVEYANGKSYESNTYQNMLLGNCTIAYSFGDTNRTGTMIVPCVSQNDAGTAFAEKCGACNLSCQYLPESWCFWMIIVFAFIALGLIILSFVQCCKKPKPSEKEYENSLKYLK